MIGNTRSPVTSLPVPTAPIADRQGQVTSVWYGYFLSLFRSEAANDAQVIGALSIASEDAGNDVGDQSVLRALSLFVVDPPGAKDGDVVNADDIIFQTLRAITPPDVLRAAPPYLPVGALTLIAPVYAQDIDTSSGPQTFTLPSAPEESEQWRVKDASGHAGTNPITVGAAGVAIDGGTSFVMNQNYRGTTFRWSSTYNKWLVE